MTKVKKRGMIAFDNLNPGSLVKTNFLKIAMTAAAVALSVPGAEALGSERASQGFAGWIQAGVGYSTSTDQLDTDADKRNDGLGSNADRYHNVIPMLLFDLRYTFSPSGRQVYFNTPQERGGPPGPTLGAVLPFDDLGKLDTAVFAKPFEEVWKDPYLTTERRSDTSRTTYGTRFTLSDILGTPTELSYSLAHADVDDDEIGERFGSLERDGWLHKARIEERADAVENRFAFRLFRERGEEAREILWHGGRPC